MKLTERLTLGSTTAGFPALRQPKPEIVDRGTVRLGDGCNTAEFPPLRQPKPEIVDRGAVRLGDGCITAEFPRSLETLTVTAETECQRWLSRMK